MKTVTHKKQAIGLAASGARGSLITYVSPSWSGDKGQIDKALKEDTSLVLTFLVPQVGGGLSSLIRFTRPLTFRLERVKVRVTQVTQDDLPLRTTADPATLLDDIAFEVLELVRVAQDPAYSEVPEYASAIASVRALVNVTALEVGGPLVTSLGNGAAKIP